FVARRGWTGPVRHARPPWKRPIREWGSGWPSPPRSLAANRRRMPDRSVPTRVPVERSPPLHVGAPSARRSPAEEGSAVHLEDLAGDERGFVGSQISNGRRDVLGPSGPADQGLGDQALAATGDLPTLVVGRQHPANGLDLFGLLAGR